jgi:hypothetical protein
MVERTWAQLYTIEGFAAALIMVVTAWIVLGTTSIYTPGDTHISDMQLEQLGTDVLQMLDTPETPDAPGWSPLQIFINNSDSTGPVLFNDRFISYCNNKTDGRIDNIQYTATIYYRKQTLPPLPNVTKHYEFSKSRGLTRGDHAVRVTHWVLMDEGPSPPLLLPAGDEPDSRPQAVLLEVLLWKG